jgi:hypothetical protein
MTTTTNELALELAPKLAKILNWEAVRVEIHDLLDYQNIVKITGSLDGQLWYRVSLENSEVADLLDSEGFDWDQDIDITTVTGLRIWN